METTTIAFSGASDDLLHCTPADPSKVDLAESPGKNLDEISYYQYSGWFIEHPDGTTFRVNAIYSDNGEWEFSIGFNNSDGEGHDLPGIPSVTTRSESTAYSTQLTISVPVGSHVGALTKAG